MTAEIAAEPIFNTHLSTGINMQVNNSSPLEYVAAFAIVFVAGVLSTAVLGGCFYRLMRNEAGDSSLQK
jgi:hypothetical protein